MWGWASLPHFVLASIFSHLSHPDRLSASLVCHKWLDAFRSPSLWRNLACDFSLGPGLPRPSKAVKFASSYGQHLRHLTVSCDWLTANRCRTVGHGVVRLLQALQRNSKLTHLSLRRFRFSRNWHHHLPWRQRTIDAISRFLTSQKHLIYVDLTEMDVSDVEAIQVLTALSASCAKSIQHLELQDFLASRQDICSNSSYVDVMNRWTGLQWMSLNYSGLDATHLIAITRNNKEHLHTLILRCRKTDHHFHVIPGFVWQQAMHLAPHLQVDWCLERIPTFRELEPLLPRTLPLHSLHFWTGYGERDENWELPRFFHYLAQHFSSCLESLHLEIEDNAESIDENLLKLVERCRALHTLMITATLGVSFVETLCGIIADNKTGLKVLHLTLSGLQDSDYEVLQSIEQKHQPAIASQGICFYCKADWVL